MDKVLIDSSTFFDLQRANKNLHAEWAQNTVRNLLVYQSHHDMLTVSGCTVFEYLDGLHRRADAEAAADFLDRVVPTLEVIYPDGEIMALAAKMSEALANVRESIGFVDTLICPTAAAHELILVNANTRHFGRVNGVGFQLKLQNWRTRI